MTSNYLEEWDKSDLDSCHGKDLVEDEDDDIDVHIDEEERGEEEEGCSCGYYCFDCLGMSWLDFM